MALRIVAFDARIKRRVVASRDLRDPQGCAIHHFMARPRNPPKANADPDNVAIALAIRRRMDAMGLQGADLADALGKDGEPMSEGHVSRILSGETTLNTKQLKSITTLLRTTRAELFNEADKPPSDDDLALRLYLSGLSPEAKRHLLSFVTDKRA